VERERYGDEFEALLVAGPDDFFTTANVICAALYERITPTLGGYMDQPVRSFGVIIRQPSAFVPLGCRSLP
jgi:hypothetical protein